jgi:hypothetical protein
MKGRLIRPVGRGTVVAAVVVLATAVRATGDGVPSGCMGQAEELDLITPNDIWHGGEAGPPDFHPDCDAHDNSCEWSEIGDIAVWSNEHSTWHPGFLQGVHAWEGTCGANR